MSHENCVGDNISCMEAPVDKKIVIIQHTIEKIKKTKEVIDVAIILKTSMEDGYINAENIKSEGVFQYKEFSEYRTRKINWQKNEKPLKDDFSKIAMISMISYAIILCKESYASLFVSNNKYKKIFTWAEQSVEPDLHAAQNILKSVRDALGHCKASQLELDAAATWDFTDNNGKPKNIGILNIKTINILLDTTNLQDVVFNWDHLGGIGNFIKILDYLQNDLEKRIKK